MAPVLKTGELKGSVGSNPTSSAVFWKRGRVAEGTPLLREQAQKWASWVQIPAFPFW